jgi:hypothetical protein
MKHAIKFAIFLIVASLGKASAQSPVVVELYQSQGCSSCPPAIANVNVVADRPDVLVLTFAVTYWDRLGWKDTFAKPEFTSRQYDYSQGLHHNNVYTPQVVIDGRVDIVGADRAELLSAIGQAAGKSGPEITFSGTNVSIGNQPNGGNADVWLVRYDPRVIKVAIGAGENSGVVIAHRNIVRDIVRLGAWTGAAKIYPIPTGGDAAWHAAVLVQAKGGGPILSAGKI